MTNLKPTLQTNKKTAKEANIKGEKTYESNDGHLGCYQLGIIRNISCPLQHSAFVGTGKSEKITQNDSRLHYERYSNFHP